MLALKLLRQRPSPLRRNCSSGVSAALEAMKERTRVKREPLRQAISEFLSPEYTEISIRMSKVQYLIWNDLDSAPRERAQATGRLYNGSKAELLQFLSRYYSEKLVHRISRNLDALSSSWLGSEYAMRIGGGAIASNICSELPELPPFRTPGHILYNFIGWDDEEEFDEYDVRACNEAGSFGDMRARVPASSRRIKDLRVVQVEVDQLFPVASRSKAFMDRVQAGSDEQAAEGVCYLYHGVHDYGLEVFEDDGAGVMRLMDHGEFDIQRALYTSTSIRHAFEHTLHSRLAAPVEERVSVLAFEVDTGVLHGVAAPPGRTSPFMVKVFSGAEDYEEWVKYCYQSVVRPWRDGVEYDIVIGPACVPRLGDLSSAAKKFQASATTLVAFCSADSLAWLTSCFRKVYQELRR